MKKYILILFALTCSVLGTYAMNLKEAYNALSNLPKITTELNDTITVSVNWKTQTRMTPGARLI